MSEKLVEMSHSLRELIGSIGKEEELEDVMASWQKQIDEATVDMSAEYGTAQTMKEMHDLLVKSSRIPVHYTGINGASGEGQYRPLVLLREELTQEQLVLVLSKLGISKSSLAALPDVSRLSPAELSKPHKDGEDYLDIPTPIEGVFCNVTMDSAKKLSNLQLAFAPELFTAME